MEHFVVGDWVVVRFGTKKGNNGIILKIQPADVYSVKVEDGSVLFFSGQGLQKKEVQQVIC
jgi:ribosomal protein L24